MAQPEEVFLGVLHSSALRASKHSSAADAPGSTRVCNLASRNLSLYLRALTRHSDPGVLEAKGIAIRAGHERVRALHRITYDLAAQFAA